MLKKAEQGSVLGRNQPASASGAGCLSFVLTLLCPAAHTWKEFACSDLSGLFTSPLRQQSFTPGQKSRTPASQGHQLCPCALSSPQCCALSKGHRNAVPTW